MGKFNPAFTYVVKLAQKDKTVVGTINMLEDFGKSEGIPLLKEMRKKIKDDGSISSRMNLKSYDEAIAHLESIKKEQEGQKNQEP